MTEQERKTLEDFLLHIDCLDALSNWQENHFNVFDVLKISRNEIRHSNVLAWLLNANANHNLGDSFFSGVIHRLLKNGIKGQTVDTAQLLLLNLYSFEIKRELDRFDDRFRFSFCLLQRRRELSGAFQVLFGRESFVDEDPRRGAMELLFADRDAELVRRPFDRFPRRRAGGGGVHIDNLSDAVLVPFEERNDLLVDLRGVHRVEQEQFVDLFGQIDRDVERLDAERHRNGVSQFFGVSLLRFGEITNCRCHFVFSFRF